METLLSVGLCERVWWHFDRKCIFLHTVEVEVRIGVSINSILFQLHLYMSLCYCFFAMCITRGFWLMSSLVTKMERRSLSLSFTHSHSHMPHLWVSAEKKFHSCLTHKWKWKLKQREISSVLYNGTDGNSTRAVNFFFFSFCFSRSSPNEAIINWGWKDTIHL